MSDDMILDIRRSIDCLNKNRIKRCHSKNIRFLLVVIFIFPLLLTKCAPVTKNRNSGGSSRTFSTPKDVTYNIAIDVAREFGFHIAEEAGDKSYFLAESFSEGMRFCGEKIHVYFAEYDPNTTSVRIKSESTLTSSLLANYNQMQPKDSSAEFFALIHEKIISLSPYYSPQQVDSAHVNKDQKPEATDIQTQEVSQRQEEGLFTSESAGVLKPVSQRWALIIGISKYRDSLIPSLRYADIDAKSFHNWLISSEGGRYSPANVKLLLNENASLQNIREALYIWLKQPISEDEVIIYFSGHGSPESPDHPENLFLLPYDTDYDKIGATAFPMWDIQTAIQRFIKAKRLIIIADACHAGGVGSEFVSARKGVGVVLKPVVNEGFQNLASFGHGVAVFTASDNNQLSQEGQQWGGGHGVFTWCILNGLKGEADYSNDGKVTLGELIPYVSENVRRKTLNAQSPTIAGKFDPTMTIAR